jgi:hypothetical protein
LLSYASILIQLGHPDKTAHLNNHLKILRRALPVARPAALRAALLPIFAGLPLEMALKSPRSLAMA